MRQLLVGLVAVLVLAGGLLVGTSLLGDAGTVAPDVPVLPEITRPPQDELGPVLLVPGYGGNRRALLRLAERIEATGRDARVLRLPGDGTGDLGAQVDLLDATVDEELAAGAPSVDVVGYSAGGVVAALWVARADGAERARRIVTLGAPLGGTTVAGIAATFRPDECPPACRQLAPASPVVTELAEAGVGDELPWLSVWTTDDELVVPPETARLLGAVNVALQDRCPGRRVGHRDLPVDPVVTRLVLQALSTEPITPATRC